MLVPTRVTAAVRRATLSRCIASSRAAMAEGGGSSGGPVRQGGKESDFAFNKREKANEDFYVREREKEKYKALRESLNQQRKHLDELESHLDEAEKGSK